MEKNGILGPNKSRSNQIGANNNDLISLLVNFSCELGHIMIRYDFLWAIRVILRNVRTDLNLT